MADSCMSGSASRPSSWTRPASWTCRGDRGHRAGAHRRSPSTRPRTGRSSRPSSLRPSGPGGGPRGHRASGWSSSMTAAIGRVDRPAVLAHPFSILPKMGLTEADIPDDALALLAGRCRETGTPVEVNEKWRCPGSCGGTAAATRPAWSSWPARTHIGPALSGATSTSGRSSKVSSHPGCRREPPDPAPRGHRDAGRRGATGGRLAVPAGRPARDPQPPVPRRAVPAAHGGAHPCLERGGRHRRLDRPLAGHGLPRRSTAHRGRG